MNPVLILYDPIILNEKLYESYYRILYESCMNPTIGSYMNPIRILYNDIIVILLEYQCNYNIILIYDVIK